MIQVLEELQKSKIKFTLESGGISVKIDDFDSINLAIVDLARQAREKYPESKFAKYYDRTLKHWES